MRVHRMMRKCWQFVWALGCVSLALALVACGPIGMEQGTKSSSLEAKESVASRFAKQAPSSLVTSFRSLKGKLASPVAIKTPALALSDTALGQNPAPKKGYIAHEWGTFTSVQASDGSVMEGLHHEEEPLPDFVFQRSRALYGKGFEVPALVTQKLETPVIYFYARKDTKVRVTVDFPKGVISEWFPNATSFEPPVASLGGRVALKAPAGGKMTWDVQLAPFSLLSPPAVSPDDIWAPSRDVPMATPLYFIDKNIRSYGNGYYVRKPIKTQVEKFIFYRGIGNFDGWFKAKATSNTSMQLHNLSKSAVPAVFLLQVSKGKGAIKTLSAMKAGEVRQTQVPSVNQFLPMEAYVDKATKEVAKALIASGLYKKEAWAMVNTWRRSYFKSQTPGIRVLYIVPRADTDTLLPIKMSPAPVSLVRTLVGRIEVLTPGVEAETIKLLQVGYQNQRTPALDLFGRFGEPRVRRACQQIQDSKFNTYCNGLLRQIVGQMQYRR